MANRNKPEERDPIFRKLDKEIVEEELYARTSQPATGNKRPRQNKRSPRHPEKDELLTPVVDQFLSELQRPFPKYIKRRSASFKRHVIEMVRVRMIPRPKRPGRTKKRQITAALKLYNEQLRDRRLGKRDSISWETIARECIKTFDDLPQPAQKKQRKTLANSVGARKRELRRRRQERRAKRHEK